MASGLGGSYKWYGLSVGAAVGLGMLAVVVSRELDQPSVGIGELLLLCISVGIIGLSTKSCIRAARREGPWAHVGSLLLGGGSLLAFLVPGSQLLAGERTSKLATGGWALIETRVEVAHAYWVVSAVLLTFFLAECLAAQLHRDKIRQPCSKYTIGWDREATWKMLVALSVPAVCLGVLRSETLQETFSARGTATGAGVLALIQWAPALAVAVGVLHRHYHSRRHVVVSLGLVVYIILAGNRSPLLLIFIAFFIRYLMVLTDQSKAVRVFVIVPVVAYLVAAVFVGISTWRGETIRGHDVSLVQTTAHAIQDPFGELSGAGLDSLDGFILATHVDPHVVHAKWTDPTKAITGFVPHQLWPRKPAWLSGEVARRYLRYGASGMFLSGAGYTWLIWGGFYGSVLAFALLGFGSALVMARSQRRLGAGSLLLMYFLVRFAFGGDAFDGFHVLGLAVVLTSAAVAGRGFRVILPRNA